MKFSNLMTHYMRKKNIFNRKIKRKKAKIKMETLLNFSGVKFKDKNYTYINGKQNNPHTHTPLPPPPTEIHSRNSNQTFNKTNNKNINIKKIIKISYI